MATPSSATGSTEPAKSIPAVESQPSPTTAPEGYKLVKVRKPDGTIVTVKRKITPEDASAAGTATAAAGTASTSTLKTPSSDNFKIVTVRQPDGSLVKVRRAVKPQDGTAPVASGTVAGDGVSQNTTPKTPNTESKPSDTNKTTTEVMVSDSKDVSNTPGEKQAAAPAAQNIMRETPAPGPAPAASGATETDQAAIQNALDEQENFFRQRKRHAFKTRLLRGVAAVAGSAVPAIEIGDFMDGDEVLSDSDWSLEDDGHDDDDDDLSDAEHELHHGAEDERTHSTDDDDKTLNHNSSDAAGHITIDAGAAVQGAGMAMAAAGTQPPPRQPPPVATATTPGDKSNTEKDKVTYKISGKDLNGLEDKTTEKATRPLNKHWANMTFYIMASLSIILPLLFLLLGIFIILMKGKSVTSHWGSLQDVIKVAISAWPIVFAAVVAQVFKAWATYKVERGIKLMELEQLIGSNSFGSAVKQPFLLRRLDLLTLVLLVVWCLSPLGSQALQRTYTIGPAIVNTTMPVLYLDMTVPNRFFSEANMGMLVHEQRLNDVMQTMGNFYMSTFLPPGAYDYDLEDIYNHPKPIWLDSEKAITAPATTSHYGVPVILTKSIFSTGEAPTSAPGEGDVKYERVTFKMTSSYFDFQCGDWSVVSGEYFNDTTNLPESASWSASLSETAHYAFYSDALSTGQINRMRFGSLIRNGSTAVVGGDALQTSGSESLHSLIDCGFTQKFVDFPVDCYQDINSLTGVPDCTYDTGTDESGGWAVHEINPGDMKNTSGANLIPGTGQTFAQNTAPFLAQSDPVTTPNEIYLGLYSKEKEFDKFSFNLSSLSTPEEFSRRMSYLFNTWMDLGNSVDYMTYTKETDIQPGQETEFIKVDDARHVYTDGRVYFISIGWVIGYFLCAGMLLVAGTLSVIIEGLTVAPDILGYVSTVARNSKYLQLPKTNSAMNGGERARVLGGTKVMMQDVKAKADVGRIALGLKHENAQPLRPGRLYR